MGIILSTQLNTSQITLVDPGLDNIQNGSAIILWDTCVLVDKESQLAHSVMKKMLGIRIHIPTYGADELYAGSFTLELNKARIGTPTWIDKDGKEWKLVHPGWEEGILQNPTGIKIDPKMRLVSLEWGIPS